MKKIDFINKYGEEAYKKRLEKKKQYYQDNKDKLAEYKEQYYQEHKEQIAEYNKQHYQENKEKWKQYCQEHKEGITEYQKQYRQENKDKFAEYHKQYRQTQTGRANYLYSTYMTADRNANRQFTAPPITSSYIVDRIFTSTCTYCGESDWSKLGCDRIDNNLPHQEGNVVCCCGKCNVERNNMSVEEFMKKREVSV